MVSSQTLPRLHNPPPQTGVGDDKEGPAGDRDLTYVVILAEAEEPLDLGRALGAETLGVNDVGQAGDLALALLDDAEGDDGEVGGDDAAADGLAAALTRAASAVARVALGEEEADTVGVHDTLLHGETLLVVATGDAEDVALPLVAERVGGDLSAHLFFSSVSRVSGVGEFGVGGTHALVHEDGELALILNVNELLAAVGRVGDVQLFLSAMSTTQNTGPRGRSVIELDPAIRSDFEYLILRMLRMGCSPSSCRLWVSRRRLDAGR